MIILAVGYLVASLKPPINGVVAQLGERLSCKQEVESSILFGSTNRNFPLKTMMNRVQLPATERLVRCVIVSKESACDGTGIRARLRTVIVWVRIPPCRP